MRALALVVLIGIVFAGCQEAPPTTNVAGQGLTDAPQPSVSAETGSITGQVLGDDQLPIAGAEIAILGVNATVVADAAGKFTFNELEPGERTLAAGKLGYDSQSRRVLVVAGETTNVTFILSPVELVEPRVESFISNGFIQFAATVPAVYFSTGVGVQNPVMGPTKETWSINATKGAVALVSTGTWQKSAAGSPTWMNLEASAGSDIKKSKAGSAAVTVQLDLPASERQIVTLVFRATPGCGTNNPTDCGDQPPNRFAQFVLQQKTTVYTDIFYIDGPPADHVASPKP